MQMLRNHPIWVSNASREYKESGTRRFNKKLSLGKWDFAGSWGTMFRLFAAALRGRVIIFHGTWDRASQFWSRR